VPRGQCRPGPRAAGLPAIVAELISAGRDCTGGRCAVARSPRPTCWLTWTPSCRGRGGTRVVLHGWRNGRYAASRMQATPGGCCPFAIGVAGTGAPGRPRTPTHPWKLAAGRPWRLQAHPQRAHYPSDTVRAEGPECRHGLSTQGCLFPVPETPEELYRILVPGAGDGAPTEGVAEFGRQGRRLRARRAPRAEHAHRSRGLPAWDGCSCSSCSAPAIAS
jgi:hypothetical protein